jgi:hypothetical protein
MRGRVIKNNDLEDPTMEGYSIENKRLALHGNDTLSRKSKNSDCNVNERFELAYLSMINPLVLRFILQSGKKQSQPAHQHNPYPRRFRKYQRYFHITRTKTIST